MTPLQAETISDLKVRGLLTLEASESNARSRLMDRRRRALQRVIALGMPVLLWLAILAFGAVQPWAEGVLQIGSSILLAAWAAWFELSPEARVKVSPLFWPALAIGGFVLLQLITGRTAVWHATYENALRYTAYGSLGFVATQLFSDEADRNRFSSLMTALGSAYAMFALLQHATTPGKLFFFLTPRSGLTAFGSYVNPNHFAGCMEMLFPLALAGCVLPAQTSARTRSLWAIAALLMGASIVFSGSRGGILVFAIEIFVFAMILFLRARFAAGAILFAALGVALIAPSLWSETSAKKRTTSTTVAPVQAPSPVLETELRWKILKDAPAMWKQRPVLGWGSGTFPALYPAFRSFYSTRFVNQAHNDYLQVLLELGILGFAALLWFLTAFFGSAWPRQDCPTSVPLRTGAFVAVLGLLVHSALDFNLEIPANATLFFVLCALATGPVSRHGEWRIGSRP